MKRLSIIQGMQQLDESEN